MGQLNEDKKKGQEQVKGQISFFCVMIPKIKLEAVVRRRTRAWPDLRIQRVGGWYHLTSRKNEWRAIFPHPARILLAPITNADQILNSPNLPCKDLSQFEVFSTIHHGTVPAF